MRALLKRLALASPAPSAAGRATAIDALIADGSYEEALARCEEPLARNPDDLPMLTRRFTALTRLGEITAALAVAQEMQAAAGDDKARARTRQLGGRLRELDPSFVPSIPGEPERPAPASENRILHIWKESLPYQTTGYTMRGRYTLLAQRDSGYEPIVVTSLGFPRSNGVTRFDPVEVIDGFPHHRLDAGVGRTYREQNADEYATMFARAAADVVRAVRPAVIIAHSGYRGYETALAGLALSRRFGIPWVYEVRGFLEATWTGETAREEHGELYRLRREQENRCMREAGHVITIAEAMRDDIVARGIDASHVSVIPNGVDADRFVPQARDPDLVRTLGLEGRIVLGYVSNLGAREGIDLLIDATARLLAAGLPVACLIVGDGPERSRLEAMAASREARGAVHVVGPVPHDQVARYYSVIDVFVIPRRPDRAARLVTPLKPFEAMALGKPLLVAGLPALVEIAAPEERGLAFRPEDASDLAQNAERLVRDEALRRRVAEAGRAWILRERTWTHNGPRYRAVVERVVRAAAPR